MKAALDQVVSYRVYENQKIIQFMHGNLFDFLGQSFCSSPSTKEFRGWSITVRLVSSLTRLDFTNEENM